MFNLFPKMIIPVSVFTPTTSTIQGEIVINVDTKEVQGIDTVFTKEIQVGSHLVVNTHIIGVVGNIIDDTTLILENTPTHISSGTFSADITNFQSSGVGRPVEFTDIFVRVAVLERYTKNTAALIPYSIKEGETIEYISKIFYGTAFYHWVIILINTIINPREEWPLSEIQLTEKIKLLYPQS